MQRCSVKFCSTLGTHVLTSVEELAAANVGVEFKDKCKGSILCPIHLAQIPGRQRQAAVRALEAAAEERKVEAAAAAANLREKLAYDRGVRDGILMATDRQNQGRRRQAVTATLFVIAVLYAGISFGQAEILFSIVGITLPCLKKEFYSTQSRICAAIKKFTDTQLLSLREAVRKEQDEDRVKGVYGSDGSWSGRRNAVAGSVFVALLSEDSKFKNKIVARWTMVKPSWSPTMDANYNSEPYNNGPSKLMESTGLLECMKQLHDSGLRVDAAVHDQDVSAQRVICRVFPVSYHSSSIWLVLRFYYFFSTARGRLRASTLTQTTRQ